MSYNEYLDYLNGSYSLYNTKKILNNKLIQSDINELPILNVSLLGSTTLDFMVTPIETCALLNGFRIRGYCAPSEQISQQCLNPQSETYQSSPDVILILTRLQDIAPSIISSAYRRSEEEYLCVKAEIISQVESWIFAIRENSNSTIIMNSFLVPDWESDQSNEATNSFSNWQLTLEVNLAVSSLVQKFSGVYFINIDRAAQQTDYCHWNKPKLWYLGRIAFAASDPRWLINLWLPVFQQASGSRKKCLVVDLDNTLWGGVVGEEGANNVNVGMGFPGNIYLDVQKQIKSLSDNGVMLAIASKNNELDAKEVFECNPNMFLKWQDFLVKKVNWSNKADNIRDIAKELNIGLEHMVFIDDNPSECELIGKELPDVTVIQVPTDDISSYPEIFKKYKMFEGAKLTNEDFSRNSMYKANIQRNEDQSCATDLESFLLSLNMIAQVGDVNTRNISRVTQMFSKTNQFNVTTIRYTEDELQKISESKDWFTFTANLVDKYGDNGLVAVALVKVSNSVAYIDSFLMSCRVISRTLETALIEYMKNYFSEMENVSSMTAKYIPTIKNIPVKNLFEEHGFTLCQEKKSGEKTYLYDLNNVNDTPVTYVEIIKES